MKTLCLMRHAKSGWDDPSLSDHDRPLTARGVEAAGLVGRHLKQRGVRPDLVLCSTARRAAETLALVLNELGRGMPVEHDRGPVLVTVEYRVRKEDRAAFLGGLHPISAERRRNGAYAWGIAEDAADPERIVEWFMVESWAEHMRQHARHTNEDRAAQDLARSFHTGDSSPVVTHLIAEDFSKGNKRRGG